MTIQKLTTSSFPSLNNTQVSSRDRDAKKNSKLNQSLQAQPNTKKPAKTELWTRQNIAILGATALASLAIAYKYLLKPQIPSSALTIVKPKEWIIVAPNLFKSGNIDFSNARPDDVEKTAQIPEEMPEINFDVIPNDEMNDNTGEVVKNHLNHNANESTVSTNTSLLDVEKTAQTPEEMPQINFDLIPNDEVDNTSEVVKNLNHTANESVVSTNTSSLKDTNSSFEQFERERSTGNAAEYGAVISTVGGTIATAAGILGGISGISKVFHKLMKGGSGNQPLPSTLPFTLPLSDDVDVSTQQSLLSLLSNHERKGLLQAPTIKSNIENIDFKKLQTMHSKERDKGFTVLLLKKQRSQGRIIESSLDPSFSTNKPQYSSNPYSYTTFKQPPFTSTPFSWHKNQQHTTQEPQSLQDEANNNAELQSKSQRNKPESDSENNVNSQSSELITKTDEVFLKEVNEFLGPNFVSTYNVDLPDDEELFRQADEFLNEQLDTNNITPSPVSASSTPLSQAQLHSENPENESANDSNLLNRNYDASIFKNKAVQ